MTSELHSCEIPCDDIAAYIDGELSAKRELELEMHFAACPTCVDELNIQKQLLRGLDLGVKDGADIDLPADFARVVVANAESTVAGLRRPKERFNAIFICGGLGLFVLMSFGITAAASLFDQVSAVASFFGHFIYDVLLGLVVIMRGVASQARPELVAALLFT